MRRTSQILSKRSGGFIRRQRTQYSEPTLALENLETRSLLSASVVPVAWDFYNFISPVAVEAKVTGTAATGTESVASTWTSDAIATQNAPFEASFDAVPSQQGCNTVLGFSSGAPSKYTNLAAIVRFNPDNNIDVRNGGTYQADAAVAYQAGTSYHFRIDVNPLNHTYDVYVTPQGGSEVQIASNYQFRSEQAATSSLNSFGGYSSVGSAAVSNLVVTPQALYVANQWTNIPVATQTGSCDFEFDAIPAKAGTDSVIGLSNGAANGYTDVAVIVRFNSHNQIDVRNGASDMPAPRSTTRLVPVTISACW